MFFLARLAAAAASGLEPPPWLEFVDETAQRLQGEPALAAGDDQEKSYAWGDLNKNGWVDLVVMRKQPFTTAGKRVNVLFMNENGVLADRTAQYAVAVAEDQLPDGVADLGFLTPTNDRMATLADFNGDEWLDLATAPTIGVWLQNQELHVDPKHIGHPRIYMNLGNDAAGQWQGLRFENARIPGMCSKTGACPSNPRFNAVTAGDVTNNGSPDLYFVDHDSAGTGIGSSQPAGHDWDNRLLINDGTGHFTDQSLARMGELFNYGGPLGMQNYLLSSFGTAGVIGDFNGNGLNDVIKNSSLTLPLHAAIKYNDADNVGHFTDYSVIHSNGAYFVSAGDLNANGRLDLVLSTPFLDRYILNLSTGPSGAVIWSAPHALPGPGAFAGNSVIVDLDNNGWNDILVTDVDVDIPGCNRFTQIYRNREVSPDAEFVNESAIIPSAERQGVYDVAAFDVTGNGWIDLVLGRCLGTSVWVNVPPVLPCPGDINGDGEVNVFDLLALLAAWGPNPGHAADLNNDGEVNVFDLLALLAAWGQCP